MAVRVDDAECRNCGEDEVYMDVKEEPTSYKVGAMCHGCDHDYGVLDRISRTDLDHMDKLYEEAEAAVESFFE